MKIVNVIQKGAILTAVQLIGQGDIFHRVISEIERVNSTMPNNTGKEKRARVLADAEIIFNDLIEPIAENILRLLIEMAVLYIKKRVA